MEQYSIQHVSHELGIPKETLRYYDKMQLVMPVRGENRYRYYTPENMLDLMYIQVMKFAGLSLAEIKRVLRNKNGNCAVEDNVRDTLALFGEKRQEALNKIESLKSIVQLIDASVAAVQGKSCTGEVDMLVKRAYHSMITGGNNNV